MSTVVDHSIRYFFPAFFDGIAEFLERPCKVGVLYHETDPATQSTDTFVYDPHSLLFDRFRTVLQSGAGTTNAASFVGAAPEILAREAFLDISDGQLNVDVQLIVVMEVPDWIVDTVSLESWLFEFADIILRDATSDFATQVNAYTALNAYARFAAQNGIRDAYLDGMGSNIGNGKLEPKAPNLDRFARIVSRREEGELPRGTIIWGDAEDLYQHLEWEFQPEIPLDEPKRARKAFQCVQYANRECYVACTNRHMLGVIKNNNVNQLGRFIRIDCDGRAGAKVVVSRQGVNYPVFFFKNRRYRGAPLKPPRDSIENALTDIAISKQISLSGGVAASIADLVVEAAELGHGCMITITDSAGILSQGQRVNPALSVISTPGQGRSLLPSLSTVDGSLIVRYDGVVPAYGVLLDGTRISLDPAHGARHNSAKRYTDQDQGAIVLAVSEDGPYSIFADGENHSEPEKLTHPEGPETPCTPLPNPQHYEQERSAHGGPLPVTDWT